VGRPPPGGARGLDHGRLGRLTGGHAPGGGRRVCIARRYTPRVTRDELIDQTKRLIAEGVRLAETPSIDAPRAWLRLSDETLAEAWGSMDRHHLAWLARERAAAGSRR
jgi:hypothetical protein